MPLYIFFSHKIETSVLSKLYFLYANHKSQNGKFDWLDKTCFLLFCFVYSFKNQSGKFPWLKRTLLLVCLLCFWLQNQNDKFLCLDKFLVFCMVYGYKIQNGNFLRLKTLFLVILLRLWLQTPKPEVSMTWEDLWFLFLFMVLISNEMFVHIALFITMKFLTEF